MGKPKRLVGIGVNGYLFDFHVAHSSYLDAPGDRTKVGHLALGGSLACCFYQCPIESRGFTSVITGLPNGTIHEKEYIREGVTICPITNNVRRKADGTNPRS
jgi:hypothetical protein